MILTDKDSGSSREVSLGEIIEVQLAENPTTGYVWTLDLPNTGLLRLVRDEFVADGSAPGTGGHHHFAFETLQPSVVTLSLSRRRPWETRGPLVGLFHVELRVLSKMK